MSQIMNVRNKLTRDATKWSKKYRKLKTLKWKMKYTIASKPSLWKSKEEINFRQGSNQWVYLKLNLQLLKTIANNS